MLHGLPYWITCKGCTSLDPSPFPTAFYSLMLNGSSTGAMLGSAPTLDPEGGDLLDDRECSGTPPGFSFRTTARMLVKLINRRSVGHSQPINPSKNQSKG